MGEHVTNPKSDSTGAAPFHTTHWSVVLAAGADSAAADAALEKLCRIYCLHRFDSVHIPLLLLFRGIESVQFRSVGEDLPLRFANFGFAPLGGV